MFYPTIRLLLYKLYDCSLFRQAVNAMAMWWATSGIVISVQKRYIIKNPSYYINSCVYKCLHSQVWRPHTSKQIGAIKRVQNRLPTRSRLDASHAALVYITGLCLTWIDHFSRWYISEKTHCPANTINTFWYFSRWELLRHRDLERDWLTYL